MEEVKRLSIAELLKSTEYGKTTIVKGWVRTKRTSKNVNFVALNDGSTIHNLQIVIEANPENEALLADIHTGAALSIKGMILQSQGSGQAVELQCKELVILGKCSPDDYPLQPKKHSLEFLREIAHLRFRTNAFGAVNRIRHSMIFAIHKFFTENGFYNVHTPIITASDCEGAGAMFHVTTMDISNLPKNEEGKIDYTQDFFGKETSLTVSGQLEVETACMALSKVYTFGPTFRAENSNTTRHLAEFWMVEPEVAFNEIGENMDLAEELLKYVIRYALDNCADDLAFLSKRLIEEEQSKKAEDRSMELLEKLNFVLENNFEEDIDDKIYEKLKDLVLEQKDNNFIQITETFKPCKGDCNCKKE